MPDGATLEEVAEALSLEEGREVTPEEVRQIEARALRKLRAEMRRRNLLLDHLAVGGWPGAWVWDRV